MSRFLWKKSYASLFSGAERWLTWSFVASGLIFVGASAVHTYQQSTSSKMNDPASAVAEKGRLKINRFQLSRADERSILQRNIFNSAGKVSEGFEQVETPQMATGALVKSELPLELMGVIFAGDPFNGLAMIKDTGKGKVGSYLVGDPIISGARLSAVYDDRVILERNGGREYIELKKFEVDRKARRSTSLKTRAKSGFLSRSKVAEKYQENGFERKGSEILISEEFKRSLLSPDSMAKVLQDAKAEPNIVGGEIRGFRLTRIREDSIYLKAGFLDGDIVEEINGIPLRDAAGAIRLLQQLKSAKSIEARVKRGGSSFDMSINIQ